MTSRIRGIVTLVGVLCFWLGSFTWLSSQPNRMSAVDPLAYTPPMQAGSVVCAFGLVLYLVGFQFLMREVTRGIGGSVKDLTVTKSRQLALIAAAVIGVLTGIVLMCFAIRATTYISVERYWYWFLIGMLVLTGATILGLYAATAIVIDKENKD